MKTVTFTIAFAVVASTDEEAWSAALPHLNSFLEDARPKDFPYDVRESTPEEEQDAIELTLLEAESEDGL